MTTFKETLKQPMDWKSIILIMIAIVGFTKGCGNEFISAHPDVKKIQQFEQSIGDLKRLAERMDNTQRDLEKQVARLEASQK